MHLTSPPLHSGESQLLHRQRGLSECRHHRRSLTDNSAQDRPLGRHQGSMPALTAQVACCTRQGRDRPLSLLRSVIGRFWSMWRALELLGDGLYVEPGTVGEAVELVAEVGRERTVRCRVDVANRYVVALG